MRINNRHGEGIVKNRRGITTLGFLGGLIAILVILGLVVYFGHSMFNSGDKLVDFDSCGLSLTSNLKGGGRCFSTSDCGASDNGWENPLKLSCPKEKPYCCHLSDPDTYYPPGTLEVQLAGEEYQSTFRISETGSSTNPNDQQQLKFEVGKGGTEEYATKGLPKKAPLFFKYRPKYESTEKCTLTYGNKKKVKKTVDCSISGFAIFNKEKLDYKQLSGGGNNKLVSIQITEEPATQTTPTTGQGTPSTSSTPKTVEYKIPFDLGG